MWNGLSYFEAALVGFTSDGDADATGSGTAEKADLGNGMRCWYELPSDKEGLISGFGSDMVLFVLLVIVKMLEDDTGRAMVACTSSGMVVEVEDILTAGRPFVLCSCFVVGVLGGGAGRNVSRLPSLIC